VLLLDASIWLAAKDADDPYFESALGLIRDPRVPVSALDLTLYEAANVVGGRWRQPDAAKDLCRTIIARCQDRLVPVGSGLIDLAIDAADEHGLTAYDAAYVAAAQSNGWTLVSTDVADLVSKGLAVPPDYPLDG